MSKWDSKKKEWAELLKIAWPLIVANSFWNLQTTIDRVFLGQYSTESLGAAISAVGVFWAPMALLQQTAAYGATFVAQYFGAKKPERIGPSIWHSLFLSTIGGLFFLLLIPVTPLLFEQFGHSPHIVKLEVEYFVALCWSALPTALMASASALFTGLGQSTVILWINGFAFLSNVIFDYLMIFGNFGFPELGIAGAGYATALANWTGAIVGLYLLFKPKYEHAYKMRSGWRFDTNLMKRFLKYGVPSGMQWALEGLAFTVFLIIVGRMADGEAALSSSGIAVTIMMLSILPALGIAQAVGVLVGQHLGNGKPEEAERASWNGVQVAFMYIATIGLTFVLIPDFYLGWFKNENNAELWSTVVVMARYILMFVAFFTLFDCLNLVFSFALKGAGDTRFVTAIALTLPWPLMVVPTWYFSDRPGAIYFAWGAATVFGVTQATVFLFRFMGGKWKSMRVIEF